MYWRSSAVVYFIVVTCIHEWRMYPYTGEVLPPHTLTLLGGGVCTLSAESYPLKNFTLRLVLRNLI